MTPQKKNQNEDQPFAPTQQLDTLVTQCPVCQLSFVPERAAVVGEGSACWMLHIRCRYCASAMVLVLLQRGGGYQSVGLLTDMTARDVERVQSLAPVGAEDVLQLHELLVGQLLW
ncbi:MAG: hypothetical protein V1916_00490 [Patescibacteria group bacterium]